MRKILVTSALPYANGSIHLGHLVEYLQTDIWVRSQKMSGNECIYICADDAHGTPIMLKAQELDITPEKLIEDTYKEHVEDFSDFLIEFDNYHSTHSEENKYFSSYIYDQLKSKGDIINKTINQFYDEKAEMFLPDRYIKGESALNVMQKINTEIPVKYAEQRMHPMKLSIQYLQLAILLRLLKRQIIFSLN